MRDFSSTFIRATKKVINQRLKRTNSPDDRRSPHSIQSPFNIPHPHTQSPDPKLYILVKTTPQGVLKKVSLPIKNEKGQLKSPGDLHGIIACNCKDPNDPSEVHNCARLITTDTIQNVQLRPGEHFVNSPVIFPNILITEPLEHAGTDILVKLPEGIKTLDNIDRDQILESLHEVFKDFGPTEIADNIYTERFTTKVLGIQAGQPSAPPAQQVYADSEDTPKEESPILPRADLSKQWRKAYPEKQKKRTSRSRSSSTSSRRTVKSRMNSGSEAEANKYTYLELNTEEPIMIWAPPTTCLPAALDIAFEKWSPETDFPAEKISDADKAILLSQQQGNTTIAVIRSEKEKTKATKYSKQYTKTDETAGRLKMARLTQKALEKVENVQIATLPPNIFNTVRNQFPPALPTRTEQHKDHERSSSRQSCDSSTSSLWWDTENQDIQKTPRQKNKKQTKNRQHNQQTQSRSNTARREEATAACPHCKALFSDAAAALQHIKDNHQKMAEANTPNANESKGKPKILKASQYRDDFISIALPNDEAAQFFQATAQTAKDPRTNTIETRYIAPRFPASILAIEDLIAFKNIATTEFNAWLKAYIQITQSITAGSYRSYENHNIGIENSYTSLMIQGAKDKIVTLKANAPSLHPQHITELNRHLVSTFFHAQRVYCLQARIEWSSWYQICISERTVGREILERIEARINSHPAATETLKKVSTFIEHIIMTILPVQIPYSQRRTEIVAMHMTQLNSAVPSVEFTRQYLDSHAIELKFLHVSANAATPLTQEEELRLQTTIAEELLHEILAGTAFFSRLQQLYLPNVQYQDIRKVPKAKILEDLARIIATDRTTASQQINVHQTTIKPNKPTAPTRCTACAALNIPCRHDHCKLHQEAMTPAQARSIQKLNMHPWTLKRNCSDCKMESVTRGTTEMKIQERNRSHKTNNRKSRSRTRSRNSRKRSKSTSKTRESQIASNPKIRAILSQNEKESEPRERKENNEAPPRQSSRDWNYSSNAQGASSRWQSRSRSPSPRYERSQSPRNRRFSKHRTRSGSRSRYQDGNTSSRYRSNRSNSFPRRASNERERTGSRDREPSRDRTPAREETPQQ